MYILFFFLPWMFKQCFLSVFSGWNAVGLSIPLWNIQWSPFTIFSLSKLPDHFSILDPASLQLSWRLCDIESHNKDILLGFSVLCTFSFPPRVEFCHWLFITQNINYLCALMKLSLTHLFQLAKACENQSRVLAALLVLHSFEVQPNYLKQR